MKALFLAAIPFILINPVGAISSILNHNNFTSLNEPVKIDEFNNFFIRFKGMIRIVMIIALMVTITAFGISLTRLSASGGNEQLRAKALKGLLFSGIGMVLFGGAAVIMGLAFGLFS